MKNSNLKVIAGIYFHKFDAHFMEMFQNEFEPFTKYVIGRF